MKDKWDKLKISSDILKNNWPIILMGLTALSSLATNATQAIYGEEKDMLVTAMTEQITIMAKPIKPKPKKTTVIIKSNCTDCRTMWLDDIREVNKRIDEWHGRK